MCGLAGQISASLPIFQDQHVVQSIAHRGPDAQGHTTHHFPDAHVWLSHTRLSILDLSDAGAQPMKTQRGRWSIVFNGEIYNHRELRKQFEGDYSFKTQSDCEVILALYKQKGPSFVDDLNGIFGFALYDTQDDVYFIARDHMGIIPLYMGWDQEGTFYVASELKALEGVCTKIELFPPGHYFISADDAPKQWYTRDWMEYNAVKDNETSIRALHDALAAAVRRQLMSDVPYGVLLSGGLDSSVTSALAKQFAAKRVESDGQQAAWWPQLHSFLVGLEGSPDLAAAQKVADHIGTVHHEIKFTIQEGLDAIRDVIYHLETYDITTVRASTPMYLMARAIKALGIKMVLSGEGADELFGGYLYFHKAPTAKDFHDETVRKLDKLHQYDCLRANKSLAAWGIEGRVPFLDKEFMDVAMRINPQDKMINGERMEKWVIRKAFEEYLPHSVAWRQKEQFSDGVGYSWIDTLKSVVENAVSDEQMANAHFRFPAQPPQNKEEFYYRSIFEEHFPSETAALSVPSVPSVACSTPIALEWDEAFKNMNDPSGRAVAKVHEDAYKE